MKIELADDEVHVLMLVVFLCVLVMAGLKCCQSDYDHRFRMQQF